MSTIGIDLLEQKSRLHGIYCQDPSEAKRQRAVKVGPEASDKIWARPSLTLIPEGESYARRQFFVSRKPC